LTKSASRGAHSPVRGHPRGSKFVLLGTPFLVLSGAGSKTGGVPSPAIEPRRERSPMAGLHELLRPPGLLAQITRSESPLYTFDLEPFPDILKHFYFKYNILLFLSNSTILSTRAPKPTYNVLVRGGGQRLGVKM